MVYYKPKKQTKRKSKKGKKGRKRSSSGGLKKYVRMPFRAVGRAGEVGGVVIEDVGRLVQNVGKGAGGILQPFEEIPVAGGIFRIGDRGLRGVGKVFGDVGRGAGSLVKRVGHFPGRLVGFTKGTRFTKGPHKGELRYSTKKGDVRKTARKAYKKPRKTKKKLRRSWM